MHQRLTRRGLLVGASALAGAAALPHLARATTPPALVTAAPSRQALSALSATTIVDTWSYNGSVPGSLLRYRRGDRLDVLFENRLPEPSAVHWHGLRPPNLIEHQAGGMMTYLTVEGERA